MGKGGKALKETEDSGLADWPRLKEHPSLHSGYQEGSGGGGEAFGGQDGESLCLSMTKHWVLPTQPELCILSRKESKTWQPGMASLDHVFYLPVAEWSLQKTIQVPQTLQKLME